MQIAPLGNMAESAFLSLESNGLLDFLPTPPRSTETTSLDGDGAKSQKSKHDRMDFDSPPPPDFDEEPSDFEDEVQAVMDQERRSGPGMSKLEMELDLGYGDTLPEASSSRKPESLAEQPVASCASAYCFSIACASS